MCALWTQSIWHLVVHPEQYIPSAASVLSATFSAFHTGATFANGSSALVPLQFVPAQLEPIPCIALTFWAYMLFKLVRAGVVGVAAM